MNIFNMCNNTLVFQGRVTLHHANIIVKVGHNLVLDPNKGTLEKTLHWR